MALESGTRLGIYEVVGAIGAGGMGEVYRAHDTKLGRDVAIKTLPSSLANEPDRLARFEREAKLLATLNHAHIGAIYGLDEHDGTQFIVMELVEGETLEQKLKGSALPVDDALRIALQIAEALEAAHDKGVVHRDLKPANVMLTHDGVVKVLDFGLAKAFLGDPNDANPAHSPALSMAMTQAGLILGTAGYMSPEQASGQATDQRADVWAFGVLLYEMLTGLPLFSGESVPHVLAAVLQTDPNWARLPKNLDPRLKPLLERCLEKKVRNRYHSIADVRIDIEKILSDPQRLAVPTGTAPTAQATTPAWQRLLPSTALVIASIAITAFVVWFGTRPVPALVNRFEYALPPGEQLRNTVRSVLSLSPSGRQFVYNADGGLYLRNMGDLEARVIPGTEPGLTQPAFSPDSQAVVYWDPQGLKRISVSGGAPVIISPNVGGNPLGISWSVDGTILFGTVDGIYRVAATGGSPELIIPTDGEIAFGPRLLPSGDTLLFSVNARQTTWDSAQVVAQSLATGERKVLVDGGSDGRYVPTGHLVYALGDGLFAVAFDPESLTVSGGAVPLVQNVLRSTNFNAVANFDVSDNGTLVYATGDVAALQRNLVWVDRTGREEMLGALPRNYVKPRISPDGTMVALDVRDQELDIWIWDLARRTLSRLTFDPGEDENPTWSPDGQRIVFSSSRDGGTALDNNLYSQAADGTGVVELLAEGEGQIFPTSFLPDGSGVLVYGSPGGRSNSNDDISLLSFDGSDRATPLLNTGFAESYPALSPDGHWLAYVSDESGREEIYVRPFPDTDSGRWQVSSDGGTQPLWAPSGQEIFYRSDEAIVVVPIQTTPRFAPGNPQALFADEYVLEQGGPNYDVSTDGERFLMIKDAGDASSTARIVIVENWFEELKRLVPTY